MPGGLAVSDRPQLPVAIDDDELNAFAPVERIVLGQASLTEAMFDWLKDDRAVHPLNLDVSLQDFAVMLNMYESALHREIRRLDGEGSAAS